MRDSVVFNYLRPKKKFPHVWCPGCGHGIVMGSIIRAIHELNLNKDDIAMVSGIGCSSRMPTYVDFNTLHTLHGRAIAFATGLKLANQKLHVIVVTGDGDATAIGGNHLIHAARRNIDLTVILLNNNIYGMTGGQVSPTTPFGNRGSTAKYGNPEQPFDIAKLVIASGGTFVARTTSYHVLAMDKLIKQSIEHKGFSMVEVFSQCPTYEGKWNRRGDAASIMRYYKENTFLINRADSMTDDQKAGKFPVGILHQDNERPEFIQEYQAIVNRLSLEAKMNQENTESVSSKTNENDGDKK
ncbi:MAG: 2-oxoacid:ferredoxin oxidoreductase subunit beta [Calditrichia bacterium]